LACLFMTIYGEIFKIKIKNAAIWLHDRSVWSACDYLPAEQ